MSKALIANAKARFDYFKGRVEKKIVDCQRAYLNNYPFRNDPEYKAYCIDRDLAVVKSGIEICEMVKSQMRNKGDYRFHILFLFDYPHIEDLRKYRDWRDQNHDQLSKMLNDCAWRTFDKLISGEEPASVIMSDVDKELDSITAMAIHDTDEAWASAGFSRIDPRYMKALFKK
jgi:hypothetical protein